MTELICKHSAKPFSEVSRYASVYVSGKITGLDDLNAPKFRRVSDRIRANGFTMSRIINPLDLHDQTDTNVSWADYLWTDIATALAVRIGAAVLLDDWHDSKGAVLEVLTFMVLGVPLYDENLENITCMVYAKLTSGSFLVEHLKGMMLTHAIDKPESNMGCAACIGRQR